MRAKLKFWVDASELRWMRMTLTGDEWPAGWAVPYANLNSWGMLPWFAAPPAEVEGLKADSDYQMSATPTLQEFDGFINNLHTLIGQIKPTPAARVAFTLEDEREY